MKPYTPHRRFIKNKEHAAANEEAVCPDGKEDVVGIGMIRFKSSSSNGLTRETYGLIIKSANNKAMNRDITGIIAFLRFDFEKQNMARDINIHMNPAEAKRETDFIKGSKTQL